jgi:hypothetical protein
MVMADPIAGMRMRRTAYERAYSNWSRANARDARAAPTPSPSSP